LDPELKDISRENMDINTEKYTNIEASRSWARYMAKDQGLKP